MSVAPRLPTWDELPAPLRTLGRWVTIAQTAGYTAAQLFLYYTTRLTPPGAAARYRGADPGATGEGPMQFPKSVAEMLTITHTHVLAMAAVFALSGAALALCGRVPERWKRFLIAEPFAAILVSFAAIWLMRYVDQRFSFLLLGSSALLALTFYAQAFLVLRELLRRPGG